MTTTNQQASLTPSYPPCLIRVKPVNRFMLVIFFGLMLIFTIHFGYDGIISNKNIMETVDRYQSQYVSSMQQRTDGSPSVENSSVQHQHQINYFTLNKNPEFRGSIAKIQKTNTGLLILYALATITYFILFLIVIYRVWKAISPLAKLLPQEPKGFSGIISPAMAAWFQLIPLFNLYWMFPVFLRMEKYAGIISSLTNTRYEGPTRNFIKLTLVCSLFSTLLGWTAYTLVLLKIYLIIGDTTTVFSIYACNIIIGICIMLLLFIMLWKANNLIPCLTHSKPLAVNPATMGGIDIAQANS